MNYYTEVLKKYAVFSGRARRAEYWMFQLFNLLIVFGLSIVDAILGSSGAAGGIGVLAGLYIVAIIIPSIAVSVRRLHDTGRSGWWLLIALIPFGGIVLLIFYVLDSQPGPNQYGPNPKEEVAPAGI
jgi:uncharacterized membrane protein YhaH (DUF805 family)